MDKEVCIIKNAITSNGNSSREDNYSSLNGASAHNLMSSNAKLNQALLVSLESQSINSVIQQASKDAKLNTLHTLNPLYPLHPSPNATVPNHKEQHEHPKAGLTSTKAHHMRPEKILERSSARGDMVDANNQNALYVVDSSGKLNLVDAQNHSQFLLNNHPHHKLSEHDSHPFFNTLGSDLPQLKKVFNPQYNNSAYQAENLALSGPSLASLNDNYFTLFANAANESTTLPSGDSLSSQSVSTSQTFAQHSPSVSIRPPAESLTNGSHSFQDNGTAGESAPVVHTRGRKRSKKGPFICSECRKEFSNQSTLTKHMITHSDERKFVCPQCSKAFKRHDHLNGHMLTHRENKPYACDLEGCDKSYCDARSLRRHKEKHKENALQCNEGLLLSQKLPGLTVTDKGIANNIYLPVNASAQLQYLALQQQKTQPDAIGNADYPGSSFSKLTSMDKPPLVNSNDPVQLSLKSTEEELNRRILASSFANQSNFASENALLHQLLTNQDRNVFKSPSTATNPTSTVIKLNDGYLNMTNNDLPSSSHLSLVSPLKSSNAHKGSHTESSSHGYSVPDKQLESNLDLTGGAVDSETDESCSTLVECLVCQKRFKTLSSLNGHMRLHGGYFKMNYLLPHKSSVEEAIHKLDSQVNMDLNLAAKVDQAYSLDYQQQQSKMFDSMVKDFMYEGGQKESEFSELNMFGKNADVDYHQLNRSLGAGSSHDQFKTPLQYDSQSVNKQIDIINQNSLYQGQLFGGKGAPNLMSTEQPHCSNSIPRGQPKQVTQVNEMMFSPITPVTPLNKNSSQFSFDFANVNNKLHVENKCKSNNIPYTTTMDAELVGESYCFEEAKENELLEKDLAIQPILNDINDSNIDTQESFIDINSNRLKNFANDEDIDKNGDPLETVTNDCNESHFDNFDLPSGKLTSDLFNRRLRKHQDDSSRTRELQSIKEIAASLKSFSQSYESSHHNLANQQMSHSYSVPTTPLVMGNNYANNQDSFQPNHMSHHSLPATPIDSSHFTFNVGNCQQSSLPSTPLDAGQQFTFAPDQNDQQADGMLNPPNFDLSCLNEPQFSNDFNMYNSKELESQFIESHAIMNYEPIDSTSSVNMENSIGPEQASANINFSSNIYPRIDSFSYNEACLEQAPNKASMDMSLYIDTQENRMCVENVKCADENKTELLHPNEGNSVKVGLEEFHSQTHLTISKDINSNYIMSSNNEPKVERILESEARSCSPKSVIKVSPLKALLSKKHSPPSTSSMAATLKKKHRPAPLYIPPHVNTLVYHSRLRSPRFWNSSGTEPAHHPHPHISPPPYTPPPMLSPVRSGSGLFWKLNNSSLNSFGPSKSLLKKSINELTDELKTPTTAYEPLIYDYDIPQTDIQPHVNIGPNFQARIPAFNSNRKPLKTKSDKDDLLWNPFELANLSADKLDLYLKLSCSACLPGQGNNIEFALHLLHQSKGDVLEALAKLFHDNPTVEASNPLSDYRYADNQTWTSEEINRFQESLLKNDKDFYLIAHEVKSKSVKECIEFYYLWKKHFPDMIKRLGILRRKRDTMFYNLQSTQELHNDHLGRKRSNGNCAAPESELSNDEAKRAEGSSKRSGKSSPYVCVKCGKKFKKLRSRSAHMKIHGNN